MNTIALTLRPPKGPIKRLSFSGPSSWNELTAHQGVCLMRIRAQVDRAPQVLYPALSLLYKMRPKTQRWLFDANFLSRKGFSEVDTMLILDQGLELLDSLAWVGDIDVDASFPARFRLYDFHDGSPRIWLNRLLHRTRYLGPQAGLGTSTFGEFMAADKAYREKNLPLLAAILYRQSDPKGERLGFDHHQAKAQAIRFGVLDPALLDRISFGFGCAMLGLQRAFPLVFPGREELQEPSPKKKASGNWLEVAIGMAKLDATKVGLIENLNLYLALKVLNTELRQATELEAELEKRKRKP